ncbi:heat shock 70 kDa protein 12B-like [Ostrea edulis]|uniref:heat shock 70 kDa protein 12B-like n=1 Tax=Ostrea edulis TaxID=37623 RepID=UPI0024AFF559|nr:heat shock 70 kDa protein 12B-like [Ostrea edulis]
METISGKSEDVSLGSSGMKKTDEKLVVVAIDVGTAYSGYAFSFRSKPDEIYVNNWATHAGEGFTPKTPSSILLDSVYNFVAFGYEAETKFSSLVTTEESLKYYFIKNFNQKLLKHEGLKRHFLVKDVFKRFIPAHGLFIATICFLREHFLQNLKTRGLQFNEDDIHYILTIPAIWSDLAKQIMRESACLARIKSHNLELAYEPEVAALHCRNIPSENLCGSTKSLTEMFQPGKKFAVLDLGGGTTDMTVQQNTLDGKLKLVHKASGGPWGGNRVNEEFHNFIREVIGRKIFENFVKENITDFLFLNGQFETKKRQIDQKSNDDIFMQLPVTLSDTYREMFGKPLSQSIKNTMYSKDIDVAKGKIIITAAKLRSFFSKTIQGIIDHVEMILDKPECKDIKYILVVGGFSESPLVVEEIRSHFPLKTVINPIDSGLSVLKGAVHYGFDNGVIVARACPLTYGISLYDTFNKRMHDLSKTIVVGEERFVLGWFEKVFTINEVIDVGTKTSIKVYESYKGKPDNIRQMNKEIEIFSSSDQNPRYVTDTGCFRHGRIVVPPPDGGWPDEVKGRIEFEFGGTELIVRYVDQSRPTDYIVTGCVDFYTSENEFNLFDSSIRKTS